MKKGILFVCVCLVSCGQPGNEKTGYQLDAENLVGLGKAMPAMTAWLIEDFEASDQAADRENLFRLQLLAGRYSDALDSLEDLRERRVAALAGVPDVPYLENAAEVAHLESELFIRASQRTAAEDVSFEAAFQETFRETFEQLNDRQAYRFFPRVEYSVDMGRERIERVLQRLGEKDRISRAEANRLAGLYHQYYVMRSILPFLGDLLEEDTHRRYIVEEGVLIETRDGGVLNATIVRPRGRSGPQPVIVSFNIYATRVNDLLLAKLAAMHGYVGVTANTRGKRLSPDPIEPYKHEPEDTHAVFDWIVEQPWSNGEVGMWGGSYGGYTSWAATKEPHPALKTIVAQAAAIPGLGLPMHNNVFLNANYCWAFFVTNNKTLDQEVCGDWERWQEMRQEWYASGRPYREIDDIDGTPNPLLQEWLEHPGYDEYWQRMVPYGEDFAGIDIPVLSITGYYDDGQVSALHYLNEHYRHNAEAEHYLVINPSDHNGVQWGSPPVLRGYELDSSARISPPELTFEWFDHVMRDGDKPDLLKDMINYQVMGADRWRHVSSMDELGDEKLRLYLSDSKSGDHFSLTRTKPHERAALPQEVDFRDRESTSINYYPAPILGSEPEKKDALVFVSEPFEKPVEISGAFSGMLKLTINKKDLDPVLILYEQLPDGRYFQLSYYLGRASYAQDMTKRHLLTPGAVESIPIKRTYMTARKLQKGSRLVAMLDINRGPWSQINYGTGKDVSDESIEDAEEPLSVQWHNDSYIEIGIRH